ncbi:MAG TPA: 5'-nucleotidase C-terminal domain-containing protein, partial [Candidatus Acidoferrales bacterium]|nr:5'-nucleotidase C-terminal domain-containing protein [Candidatus Acidoferrales bacterium]
MKHISRRFFLACAALLLAAAIVPVWPQAPAARVHITLLGTTDLHGNIFPVDYYLNQPANRGLAKIATLVRQVRSEEKNVLLLDSGDTIQGTPLAYYFARKDTSKPNPTIAAMNALGYEAMALGNHEFNFGLAPLWKAKRESKFPWLAANLRQRYKSGVERFAPYIIRNVGGVRVAIVGFVTPGVPRWEIPANYKGYQFELIPDAARRVIPEVRKKADVVVVIAHSGLERDPQTGETYSDQMSNENAVGALAEQVPGIDVIMFGHSHRELPEKIINGVLLVQAKNWGQSLARVDVELERADARWKIASKHSTTIPVTDAVAADPEILKLAQPYHDATEKYLDTPIATSDKSLDGSTARYEDHPFVDQIHKAQLEYGKADVSLATMFFLRLQIPAGKVTLRQIAGLYIYENTLYTVEMNGKQLREVLEHAAEFFPGWPLKEGERMRLPGFNADCAQGVEYVMDLMQPVGQRIRDLRYKGQPLADDQKLRVAINNYRY